MGKNSVSISHPGTCTKVRPQLMKTGGCKWLVQRHSKVTMFDSFQYDRYLSNIHAISPVLHFLFPFFIFFSPLFFSPGNWLFNFLEKESKTPLKYPQSQEIFWDGLTDRCILFLTDSGT